MGADCPRRLGVDPDRSAGLSGAWQRRRINAHSGAQDQTAMRAAPGAAPAHFFRSVPRAFCEARLDEGLGHLLGAPALDLLFHNLWPGPVQEKLTPAEQGEEVAARIGRAQGLELADGVE